MFEQQAVQAFITTISFPATLADVAHMGQKNPRDGAWYSDLDMLVDHGRAGRAWTAPRWAGVGDIMFFYCTQSAGKRSQALYRAAITHAAPQQPLINMLARAATRYPPYAGTIFAVARVREPARNEGQVPGHFKSTIFAEFRDLHFFDHPLSATIFKDHVKIGQNTITPLYGPQLEGIRSQLRDLRNRLPRYLAWAKFGARSFRNVTAANWDAIVTKPELRFIHEAQLRSYWLDYLLDALKDPRTARLEECQCYKRGATTGLADYCIRVEGQWLPVEAKLNIEAERDLLGQISRYVGADGFMPTRGPHREDMIQAPTSDLCLIADQRGIYAARAGGFIECQPGQPLWRRDELGRGSVGKLRAWLKRQWSS